MQSKILILLALFILPACGSPITNSLLGLPGNLANTNGLVDTDGDGILDQADEIPNENETVLPDAVGATGDSVLDDGSQLAAIPTDIDSEIDDGSSAIDAATQGGSQQSPSGGNTPNAATDDGIEDETPQVYDITDTVSIPVPAPKDEEDCIAAIAGAYMDNTDGDATSGSDDHASRRSKGRSHHSVASLSKSELEINFEGDTEIYQCQVIPDENGLDTYAWVLIEDETRIANQMEIIVGTIEFDKNGGYSHSFSRIPLTGKHFTIKDALFGKGTNIINYIGIKDKDEDSDLLPKSLFIIQKTDSALKLDFTKDLPDYLDEDQIKQAPKVTFKN